MPHSKKPLSQLKARDQLATGLLKLRAKPSPVGVKTSRHNQQVEGLTVRRFWLSLGLRLSISTLGQAKNQQK